jgi:hypothetical protein
MTCFHWALLLSVLIEAKEVALAGAISAPAMPEPLFELAELLLLLPPHAASTSRQVTTRAREREIRRSYRTSEAE